MKLNKKNIPLYLALAIPVIMVIALAISIYLPSLWHKPKQNFVYETGDVSSYGYNEAWSYQVQNGRLTVVNNPEPQNSYYANTLKQPNIDLYEYNVTTGQVSSLTADQAESLQLDPSTTLPMVIPFNKAAAAAGDCSVYPAITPTGS